MAQIKHRKSQIKAVLENKRVERHINSLDMIRTRMPGNVRLHIMSRHDNLQLQNFTQSA